MARRPPERWLWVTDFDGSLSEVGRDEVAPATQNVVRRWVEAGNLYFILTGRSYTPGTLATAERADLVIYEEGGVFVYPASGRIRVRGPRLSAEVRALVGTLQAERGGKPGAPPWVGVTEISSLRTDEAVFTPAFERLGYTVIAADDPIAIHPEDSPTRAAAKHRSAQQRHVEMLAARGLPVRGRDDRVLQITYNQEWIEYLPHGMNKTSALRAAAREFDARLILATGDGDNDTFLRIASESAAVANASPGIKHAASYVTEGSGGAGASEAALRHLGSHRSRRAGAAFDERALDRFWSDGAALDASDEEQYERLVQAFFALNPGALEQVSTAARRPGGRLLRARDWPYRVVRGEAGHTEVVAWAADRRTAVEWMQQHRGDLPGVLDAERTMLSGRWLVTDTMGLDAGAWTLRDRVAERAGRFAPPPGQHRRGHPGLAA